MNVWIDFNDILTWPLNHITGIQKVVVKVAEQIIKNENYRLFSASRCSSEAESFSRNLHRSQVALWV